MNNIFDSFNIDERLIELSEKAQALCVDEFCEINKTAEYNGQKVLSAFIKNRVSDVALKGSTGYGYGDVGRDILDRVFADAFGAEDALVRHNFVSGTHALSVALFGVLRTGDTLLAVTGKPYDTLEEVIGISGEKGNGSLMDFGVSYEQVELLETGKANIKEISEKAKTAKVAYIQRSRGYSLRPALTIEEIGEIVKTAKKS